MFNRTSFSMSSRRARIEDDHKVKYLVPLLINASPTPGTGYPTVDPLDTNKTNRGFNHIRKPEEISSKYQNGTRRPKEGDNPLFMYDQNMYDRNRAATSLSLVFRAIFTGPRTATADPGMLPSKAPITKKNQMTTVTPRHIAYAAFMTRYSLSSQSSWTDRDGRFKVPRFFLKMIGLFKDVEWAKETVDWWNAEVFATEASKGASDDEDDETASSLIEAQRE
ncbi:hypothetical protein K474DRAFT_1751944 [Panus rudis PR-1116 ss-1]|nr:hypothetical protein K474DRAFT_1751944 [Panus rudis PR-1116 ss-1]